MSWRRAWLALARFLKSKRGMQLAVAAVAAVTILAAAHAPAAAQAPGATPPGAIGPTRPADPYWYAPSYVLPEAPVVTVTRTYRSHIMLTDLAALGLAAGLRERGAQIGSLVYAFGPPVIHFAHGNRRSGWTSVGLRLGLPALGAMAGGVGAAMDSSCNGSGSCGPGYVPYAMVIGAAAGMATAMIVDWTLLAKKTEQRRAGAGWAPVASVTPDGVAVGAVGRF
jgi:hypothetical protein